MATIDVSVLLDDPDFSNDIVLVTRAASANAFGEGVIVESAPIIITVVVQGVSAETITRVPDSTRLEDAIEVYLAGVLSPERPGGYSDIVIWNGKRYEVFKILGDYMNYGAGFTHALCRLVPANA